MTSSASPAELEEEIAFMGVLLDTLDPYADDYETRRRQIEADRMDLQSQLDSARASAAVQSSNQNTFSRSGMMGQQRDGWWNAAIHGRPNSNASNTSFPDLSSASNTAIDQGMKRARPQSSYLDPFEHASKRQTPEPSNAGTPASSDGSYESIDRPNERMRASQAAGLAAAQRRLEDQQRDAKLARELWQSQAPPTNMHFSSRTPSVQTTLNHNGTFQRPLPPPVAAEPSSSSRPPRYPAPTGYHHAYQHQQQAQLPQMERAQAIKPEPGYNMHQQLPQRHRQQVPSSSQASVVDLTGSDSEEEDIAEIAPNTFTPSRRNQMPQGSHLPSMRSLQMPISRTMQSPTTMNIPGAFPRSSLSHNEFDFGNADINPANLPPNINNPGTQWLADTMQGMQSSVRNSMTGVVGRVSGGLSQLNDLVYGSNSSRPFELDSDDDDIIYGGSRQLPGMYAGNQDLYNARYDAFANYDPSRSKEEIQAMLENIRPDEDMPAHLRVRTPDDMNVELHKYQELGLTWLTKQEEGKHKGGILADDMGLGKTIQMLSLMVTRKSPDPARKTTLIIAPVALMRQWRQEIQNRLKPGARYQLTVFTHHGQRKAKSYNDLRFYDVVLTTYGTIATELKRLEKFTLRKHHDPTAQPSTAEKCIFLDPHSKWYRVILDEAQCIKNKNTQTSKGCCMLNAEYRFCVTGTPMMNNVGEFFALLKFLRIQPYCQWERFRMDINNPLANGTEEARQAAMQKLQVLCRSVMLRRTKQSKFEGKPILVLPERLMQIDHPEFDEHEANFYHSLENQTQLTFNKYLKRGTVGKQYSAILVLLLRLRQACCHPHLIKDFGVAGAAGLEQDQMLEFAKQLSEPVVARIKETGGNFECPVCYDSTPNPAIFIPCGHDTCSECFAKIADPANAVQRGEDGAGARCPNCRGSIDPKRLTDFQTFKRVHMPELLTEEEIQAQDEVDDDDSDTDSNADSEDDDKDDDLDGFVIPDDIEPEQADNDDDTEDDLDKPSRQVPIKAEKSPVEEGAAGPSTAAGDTADQESQKDTLSNRAGKDARKKKKNKGKERKKHKPKETLAELKKQSTRNKAAKKKYLRRLRRNWISSAKIDMTMDILRNVMKGEEGEKVLIFSQWTSLLDLLEVPIDEEGITYRRYDGSMSAAMRGDAVDDFRDERKNVRVMLVSLKAGNAGLNLNMASQVIILDPFWNPYIEEQAIDRAHRLGQRRNVTIHRVLIQNTVEDRIIALQEQKRRLISEALDEQKANSLGRLGVQELAYLFGVTHDPSQRINYVPQHSR